MTDRGSARWNTSRLRSFALDITVGVVLVLVAFWHLLPAVETTPFHRDEARWIHRISYLSMWSDPFGEHWQDEGYDTGTGSWDERYRMRAQPPFAPYVLAIGHLLQGRDLETNGYWIMDYDDAWNAAHGNMPTTDDLHTARRTNVGVAALTAVVVYFLGKRLTNRVGGVIGALVLIFHPLVLDTSTRAWSDPTLMLMIALAALAAARFAERPTWFRAVLLGIALGLGGSAKLSPLVLSFVFVGFALLAFLLPRLSRFRPAPGIGWKFLSIPVISLAAFELSYPYLWPRPIRNTYRLLTFRTDSFESQGSAFPQAKVTGLGNAIERIIGELGTSFSLANWLSAQLEAATEGAMTLSWIAGELDLVLALVGAILMTVIALRRGLFSAPMLALAVLGGEVVLITVAMGVEYARYLLPIVLAMAVWIGVLGGILWQGAWRLGSRLVPAPATASRSPESLPMHVHSTD